MLGGDTRPVLGGRAEPAGIDALAPVFLDNFTYPVAVALIKIKKVFWDVVDVLHQSTIPKVDEFDFFDIEFKIH